MQTGDSIGWIKYKMITEDKNISFYKAIAELADKLQQCAGC